MDPFTWHGTLFPSLSDDTIKNIQQIRKMDNHCSFFQSPRLLRLSQCWGLLNPTPGGKALSYLFFWWGGVGVYPLRALYPIPRQALGYVRPLLNIKSPPSASVFSLRRLPDSQGHDHICPTIPRVGGEREGREQLVYMRQIQKGCYSGPRPRACPKSHSLVHSVSACDLRCTAWGLPLGSEMRRSLGDRQGQFAL